MPNAETSSANLTLDPTSGSSSRTRSSQGVKKLKLEMCVNIVNGAECPFGSECTYAHERSQLRLTTLQARVKAGLVDAQTYRTRPCLDHVMTGSW